MYYFILVNTNGLYVIFQLRWLQHTYKNKTLLFKSINLDNIINHFSNHPWFNTPGVLVKFIFLHKTHIFFINQRYSRRCVIIYSTWGCGSNMLWMMISFWNSWNDIILLFCFLARMYVAIVLDVCIILDGILGIQNITVLVFVCNRRYIPCF